MKYLIFIIFFLGCRNPHEEAKNMENCPFWGRCSGDNVCLRKSNICVKPCQTHDECPEQFLCKGYFKNNFNFSGRGEKFCKKSILEEGEGCGLNFSCKLNLTCVDNICRKMCIQDTDCVEDFKCSLEVFSVDSFAAGSTYKVCAKANIPNEGKCDGDKEPYCKRGSICMDNICKKLCEKHKDCLAHERCNGRGFSGWKGRIKIYNGDKPDLKYCVGKKTGFEN